MENNLINAPEYNELLTQASHWRRHLHQHPELSFEEHQTTDYIKQQLTQMGIPFDMVSPTGVIGFIQGNKKSARSVALRADIDALPIREENTHAYCSKNLGCMHACGHDYHTANLLATAKILQGMRNKLDGNIILIFQAAEERIPGGAKAIVESGILDNRNLGAVIGLHVSPQLPVGQFGFKSGIFMASADEIYIDVHGKGGHAAQPQLNIDPVSISAQLLVGLQQIVSRGADPRIPSVLSFGRLEALGAANVIPDSVHMAGTFRTTDEAWREKALLQVEKFTKEQTSAMGATATVDIKHGYPALVNDANTIAVVKQEAQRLVGTANAIDVPIWMAAEDFAYYTQKYPAAFFLVGTKNEQKGICSELHTPTFDIDESIFKHSIVLMVNSALALLNKL